MMHGGFLKMPGTIELTNTKIIDKFETIRLVFEQISDGLLPVLDACGADYRSSLESERIYINLLIDNFNELESSYNLAVVHIVASYYSNTLSSYREDVITRDFYQIVNAGNFLSKMDEYLKISERILSLLIIAYTRTQNVPSAKGGRRKIVSKAASAKATVGMLDRDDMLSPMVEKIRKHIEYAKSIAVQIEIKKSNYEICTCGERMVLLPISSELMCQRCGMVRNVQGTSSDDQDAFMPENSNVKHGKYDPHRHFRYWMERIQADRPKVFPPEDIAVLDNLITKNDLELNTVQDMRNVLKEVRMTQYNDYAPLLMKMFTGRAPPRLSFAAMRRFSIKFNKIIGYLERIKSPDGNRPYYPYFIYKIIEDEIERANNLGEYNEMREYKRMLLYIHLQADDTVMKHDETYKEICELSAADSEATDEDRLTFRITNKDHQRV